MKSKRVVFFRSPFAVALSLFCFIVMGCSSQGGSYEPVPDYQATSSGPRIKAPDFALKDLKGQKFSLEKLKGRVVFLDFWATWCPPCVASVPEVEKMHDDYDEKDVVILSISVDHDDTALQRFIERRNLKGNILFAGSSAVSVHYRVDGVPAFYLIDQKGYVVNVWTGFSPAMPRAWRREIDRLLKK